MYFYVNDGKIYLCSCTTSSARKIDAAMERREKIEKLLRENGVTPENSVSTASLPCAEASAFLQ